jgi:hypothetical protein
LHQAHHARVTLRPSDVERRPDYVVILPWRLPIRS